MKKFVYIYVSAILVNMLAGFNCYAGKPYADTSRVAYISSVLQAFSKTTNQIIDNTYRYISVVDKNNCQSSLSDLRTECLISYANKNCAETDVEAKDRCELYSDIIVANKLSEKIFINKSDRYRILKNSGQDYRKSLANRLQQKYARIVTQFSLTGGAKCHNDDSDCLAKALDQFCLDYTNSKSLSWQYCMSASLWFIGTSKIQ